MSKYNYNGITFLIGETPVKASIIPIGNSRGIRIPKTIIEQCGFGQSVSMEVTQHSLVIKPLPTTPRSGWKESFHKMAKLKEDTLLISDNIDLEMDSWEW